jgi:hypothetical protein
MNMKQEVLKECPDFDKFVIKYEFNLRQQILRSNKKVIKDAEKKLKN